MIVGVVIGLWGLEWLWNTLDCQELSQTQIIEYSVSFTECACFVNKVWVLVSTFVSPKKCEKEKGGEMVKYTNFESVRDWRSERNGERAKEKMKARKRDGD